MKYLILALMFSNVILTHAQVQSNKNVAKNDSTFTIEPLVMWW